MPADLTCPGSPSIVRIHRGEPCSDSVECRTVAPVRADRTRSLNRRMPDPVSPSVLFSAASKWPRRWLWPTPASVLRIAPCRAAGRPEKIRSTRRASSATRLLDQVGSVRRWANRCAGSAWASRSRRGTSEHGASWHHVLPVDAQMWSVGTSHGVPFGLSFEVRGDLIRRGSSSFVGSSTLHSSVLRQGGSIGRPPHNLGISSLARGPLLITGGRGG